MLCSYPILVNDILTGCGQCLACRVNLAKDWEVRSLMTRLVSKQAYFYTLTYDDTNIPKNNEGLITLDKQDLQNHVKRLRDKSGLDFRFYNVGEYGDNTFRAHYHSAIFCKDNINMLDLHTYLKRSWVKGFVQIYNLDLGLTRYIIRYVINRNPKVDKLCYHYSMTPPFALMSRNPALGLDYVYSRTSQQITAMIQDNSISIDKKYRLPVYIAQKLRDLQPDTFQYESDKRIDRADRLHNEKMTKMRDLKTGILNIPKRFFTNYELDKFKKWEYDYIEALR